MGSGWSCSSLTSDSLPRLSRIERLRLRSLARLRRPLVAICWPTRMSIHLGFLQLLEHMGSSSHFLSWTHSQRNLVECRHHWLVSDSFGRLRIHLLESWFLRVGYSLLELKPSIQYRMRLPSGLLGKSRLQCCNHRSVHQYNCQFALVSHIGNLYRMKPQSLVRRRIDRIDLEFVLRSKQMVEQLVLRNQCHSWQRFLQLGNCIGLTSLVFENRSK